MANAVRGSTIFFSATCLDRDGSPITPASATLALVFIDTNGARQRIIISMDVNTNVVTASWDSSVARDGLVRYSITATGSDKIAQDGDFTLTANEANG